ncbi:MAG TPA: enoyl-CoA hydratase-related protein [Streptosporangiaceae bacterium]|nr:enoyl-CoA hydratase-related protein [Streptosporangiaceae bacterium]
MTGGQGGSREGKGERKGMSSYKFIDVEVSDYIATVTVDRPPANAMSLDLYDEIGAVFREVGDLVDDVRVAILTARGKYFCAGRDVKVARNDPPEKRSASVRAAFGSLLHCAVPVIGAINGPALGAGYTLATFCDLLVASELATFALPEINFGLCGGYTSTRRGLTAYQGRKLAFTGEPVSAETMREWGVVDQVVPPGELMAEARKLAAVLAGKSPLALRMAKWSANEVDKILDFEQAYRAVESRASLVLAASEDHAEANLAFKEKRAPRFVGR